MEYKSSLQYILELAGGDTRSYSGRGMDGRECLGVDLPDLQCFPLTILEGLDLDGSGNKLIKEVYEEIKNWKWDQMGKGVIVYFPRVPFVSDED